MDAQQLKLIAVQVGDLLKWDSSVNEIGRVASALFSFERRSFPNESITSTRAQAVHDWVLSLGTQPMDQETRIRLLTTFCRSIAGPKHRTAVDRILDAGGIGVEAFNKEALTEFGSRSFHPVVVRNSRDLFCDGHFFHAVFEAAKAYNKLVREKARSAKDGQALMMDVWAADKGVLKLTPCKSETDRNVQDGIKFLSAGLMQAIRNPTAHEPALDWPITKADCLEVLGFISFLLRKLDDAVCVAA